MSSVKFFSLMSTAPQMVKHIPTKVHSKLNNAWQINRRALMHGIKIMLIAMTPTYMDRSMRIHRYTR